MQVPLVVDVNEPEDLAERLRELKVPIEVRRIAPGDYILGPIGVERKTITDFFNSMVRKRLFEQVQRLREAYPKRTVAPGSPLCWRSSLSVTCAQAWTTPRFTAERTSLSSSSRGTSRKSRRSRVRRRSSARSSPSRSASGSPS